MGCGASVAAYLNVGIENAVTSLGSTIETEILSDVSTNVPISDWTPLDLLITPRQIRRIHALNLELSEAQIDWYIATS